jgi:aminobenzoyl-glutamate transport protein
MPTARGVLDVVERAGNALPDPITLFGGLTVATIVSSSVCARLGVAVPHPHDGSLVAAVDLANAAGVRRLLTEAVRNFTGFAPLGMVLVAMLGIGVAEAAGLVQAALRAFVSAVPASLLTAAVVFAGVNANMASDAGILVLPPIAALLFAAVGRHPLAGIAAAFAGVSAGFSANLVPTTLDVLLAGFTREAVTASRLAPGYEVQVLGNWYLMAAATPLLTAIGTVVTHRVVEPRLGRWQGTAEVLGRLGPGERRGLWAATAAFGVVLLAMALAAAGPLRDPGGTALASLAPFFDSLILWILLVFLVPGVAYGVAAGTVRSDRDIARMAGAAMSSMGPYIALAFVAAQFIACFGWSNLGAILAISGARAFAALGLHGAPLLVALVVLTAGLDLLLASASAKWAVLAPVVVPMFLLLGFTPEATQAAYRIGDSCTNVVTPLMPYLPYVLTVAQRYEPKTGTGTMVALMLPYSASFAVGWTALLLGFYALDLPIGPGVGFSMP